MAAYVSQKVGNRSKGGLKHQSPFITKDKINYVL